MTEKPIKIHLDGSTYVTKVNGKVMMVRERHERLRDICLDLLKEAFGKCSLPKMKDHSKSPKGEIVSARNPAATPSQNSLSPPLYNPHANLIGLASGQSIMGPIEPQPGIYRFGNRQLALLPLNPQGGPVIPPQMGYPYPQSTWMLPQTSSMSGFSFSPIVADRWQFATDPAPAGEVASQTSITVTKHVCAECGVLRSRKFQHENPLKPGEKPSPALCKKCQKDVTSTEESDTSMEISEKQHKLGRKKTSEAKGETNFSRHSADSEQSQRVSKSKNEKTRNKLPDEHVSSEESRSENGFRNPCTWLHKEDYVPRQKQASPQGEKMHLSHLWSISSQQNRAIGPPVHRSRADDQSRRHSRASVATDAAEAFHHSRRAPSQSTYDAYDTGRVSKQFRSYNDSTSSEAISGGGHSFEDQNVCTPRTRSEEASRRRRFERSVDHQGFHQKATRPPYNIDTSEVDKVEVVRESHVARPRPASQVPVEHFTNRRQDMRDKTTAGAEKPYPRVAVEVEAADYYRNDWPGASEHDRGGHRRVRPKDLEGMIVPDDSRTSDTTSSSRYRAGTDEQYVPRAPRPLRSHYQGGLRAQVDLPRYDVPYYQSSEDESLPLWSKDKCSRARDQEGITREPRTNTYRPPYVREATDMGTERALMPSPKHLHENLLYPDTNESELTEEIERVERHVAFQDLEGYEDGYDILNGKVGSARVLRKEGRR